MLEKPNKLYSGHELINDVTAKIPAMISKPILTKPVIVPDINSPMISAATMNLIILSAYAIFPFMISEAVDF